MTASELDERYLGWLYGQVASVKTRAKARTHWHLFRQLQDTIFVAFIPFDENRIADGKDLRYEYLKEIGEQEQGVQEWLRTPCSMLELLIVLARQLSFETDDPVKYWFWRLIYTVDLDYNDLEYNEDVEEVVADILDRIIWRSYDPDGTGGLFPLKDPREDQRDVELWYQLNAYLIEHY